ncbi:MAG: hypothetical protein KGH75_04490 [Rhodospirillales bacterium]|nr:hypothetical protein [Rhodospirillales bacterium]
MTALFEACVIAAYERCAIAWAAHEQHPLFAGTAAEKTCKVTDQCDELTHAFGEIIDSLFKPEDAERWLAAGPPDLLEWALADQGGDRLRDAVVATLSSEAWSLIFPVDRPTPDPVMPYG